MKSPLQHAIALALVAGFTFSSSPALAAPGDYDGDGRTDPMVALIDRSESTTTYFAYNPSAAQGAHFSVLGLPGDALVAGRWFAQDARTFPGAVFVRSTAIPLEWRIGGPDGLQMTLSYGLPGDQVPNQSDLDCDGITDLAVIRTPAAPHPLAGFNLWYLRLSSQNFQIVETLFGIHGDRMMTSDVDGDGCGELVALRNGFLWFTRDALGGETTMAQWGLPGDFPLPPVDLDGDHLTDFIISRPTGNGQVAYIRYGNGQTATVALGGDGTIPDVADYLSDAGLEFSWWDRASSLFTIRRQDGSLVTVPFGIATNALIRASNTVVQPNEDGRFGANNSGGGSGGGGSAGCNPTPDSPDDFRDGSDGLLWKPHSEGVGNGAPAMLFPSSTLGAELTILGSDGTEVSDAQRSNRCCPNGGRNHFWARKTATQLRPHAPLTVKLTFRNSVWCLGVPDPTKRWD